MSLWPGVDGATSTPPILMGIGQELRPIPFGWWNPLNSAAISTRVAAGGLWAWRAQANDNITWGPGPANYAASKVSVEGNSVTLTEGNGAVPWAPAVGWTFVAASLKYFLTGVVPTDDQAYVIFVQFSNQANFGRLSLARTAAQREFGVTGFAVGGPARAGYWNGNVQFVVPGFATGNIAVVGNQGYRDGVVDGPALGIWAGTSIAQIPIGCQYNAGADSFVTAEIQAVLICDDNTAFTAADITAIAASPGGSMQNL